MSLPTLLNPKIPKLLFPLPTPLLSLSVPRNNVSSLFSSRPQNLRLHSLPPSSLSSTFQFQTTKVEENEEDEDDEEHVIGDCLVFEEGIFEDPYLQTDSNPNFSDKLVTEPNPKPKGKKNVVEIKEENLVPEQWREVQAELNLTKRDKKKIALELQHGSRVERKKKGLAPVRNVNLEEYLAFKEAKLAQLKPLVLDEPKSFRERQEGEDAERTVPSSERVKGKNPRWAVYGKGLDDVTEFLNSGNYVPGEKNSEGRQKLFTKEEKVQLNRKIPDLALATSDKWLPLHALAASGEFYLMDALLKHSVDINAVDKDGLTALHKAIIGKKQAITNYLLRESANPFVHDKDGATLMHYAVQTASSQAIKVLLLYNVDINLQDNDGWTPLHIAVQARRTDVVRLLLIKGADKTLKNKDGLTPLDLCLYSGRDTRTCELIKLLKQLPKTR